MLNLTFEPLMYCIFPYFNSGTFETFFCYWASLYGLYANNWRFV